MHSLRKCPKLKATKQMLLVIRTAACHYIRYGNRGIFKTVLTVREKGLRELDTRRIIFEFGTN